LTGKVVSETGGVVTFQSDMAGKADGSGGGTITVEQDQGTAQRTEVCHHHKGPEAKSGKTGAASSGWNGELLER
jgi:hypothetical protein